MAIISDTEADTRAERIDPHILKEFKQSLEFRVDIKVLENLSDNQKRYEVLKFAQNSCVPIKKRAEAIFAWGRMRRDFQSMLLESTNTEWLDLCKKIHNGDYTRADAYTLFSGLQSEEKIKGMGPAYFTKLIYFLMPENGKHPSGYIMDQWAGCSVNLLCGQDVVLMNSTINWKNRGKQSVSSTVSNANSGEHYEDFCYIMDALKKKCDLNRHTVDIAVMSKGGRKPLPWRAFVKNKRKQQFLG